MNITRAQARGFIEALFGRYAMYQGGRPIYHSPHVIAFFNGALPRHGAIYDETVWRAAQTPVCEREERDNSRIEELAGFLEAVARCLRSPDEGRL